MADAAAKKGSTVEIRVADSSADVELSSVSPSGLAVLFIDDEAGSMRAALSRALGDSTRVRLVQARGSGSSEVQADLIWFEVCKRGAKKQRLEVIVDGSDSPQWQQFLATARIS